MTLKAELRGAGTAGLLGFAGVLLLISVPRGIPGIELLQSLRFHIAALGIPLALALLLGGARWRAGLAIVLMGASLTQGALPLVEGYQRRGAVEGDVLSTIKVLSFNVLSNRQGKSAADFIIREAPDIAVIMEAPGIESFRDDIAKVLPYRLGCDTRQHCDIAVFSRTPFIDPQIHRLPPFFRERLAVAATVINGVPLTVVGIHLSKPYFDEAAWTELDIARKAIDAIDGRVIVSGDFNAAAWSDEVATFSNRTDLVPPPMHPATWPVRAGPLGVPIDNMFTRGAALIDTIEAPSDSYGSNHRALLAEVSLLSDPATLPR